MHGPRATVDLDVLNIESTAIVQAATWAGLGSGSVSPSLVSALRSLRDFLGLTSVTSVGTPPAVLAHTDARPFEAYFAYAAACWVAGGRQNPEICERLDYVARECGVSAEVRAEIGEACRALDASAPDQLQLEALLGAVEGIAEVQRADVSTEVDYWLGVLGVSAAASQVAEIPARELDAPAGAMR